MILQTFCYRHHELHASQGSVFDPRTNLGVYQPPLGHGAPSIGVAHLSLRSACNTMGTRGTPK